MENSNLKVLEIFASIYEEMDINKIERRFVELVSEIFSFDRVGLFFAKHQKGTLKGKLSIGFEPGEIENFEAPMDSGSIFYHPLITGTPHTLGSTTCETLGPITLCNSALIPVINRRPVACWEQLQCPETLCPAHGKLWLRCWMVPEKKCGATNPSMDPGAPDCQCHRCPVYLQQDISATEGLLLVDNTPSGTPISEENIKMLSIIAYAVGVAINNTKRYSRVLDFSIRDDLTRLHNRRHFEERLLDEVDRCKRHGDPLALVMCDIDHFKRVNDSFGHPFGDQVLITVAQCLQQGLRKSDIVSRYGGEEFAFLLLETDPEGAALRTERLRAAIESLEITHEDQRVRITASFGIASFGRDATSLNGLISQADQALYRAKALGRNQVCLPH